MRKHVESVERNNIMRVLFSSAVLVGMLALAAAPVAAQQPLEASLSFVSDPGDYIGAGQSRSFTLDTASITSRSGQNGGSFGVTVFPFNGGFWFLDIAAPQGAQLVPGAYEGAVRYPFQGPGQPGLSLSGDGRGCNTLTGRFDVLEATFGPNGYVERFHATFEQHCEGAAAALFGEVQIVNPPPPPPLQISLTIDTPGHVNRQSGKVLLTGMIACTTSANVSVNTVLTQRLNRFALATANANLFTPCSPTASPWTFEFTPQGNVPFGNGMAQLDLVASGFDSYYGTFVNISTSYAIKLLPSR
jgi:hypothetical protein